MKEGRLAIVITLYQEHLHYFKVLIASIKYFNPDIPVIILKDGDFFLKNIENVKIIDVKTINKLHGLNLRGLLNKLNMFYLPEYGYDFDYYLHLDADSVLLTNINYFLPDNDLDFAAYQGEIINYEIPTLAKMFDKYAFNPQDIDTPLLLNKLAYFSGGHFLIHRSFLNKEIIIQYRKLMNTDFDPPNVFKSGDQGFWNFYVNYSIANGNSRILLKNIGIYGKENPAKYPSISLKNILSKANIDYSFIHYTAPSRKVSLKKHHFGVILWFFYLMYYKKYSNLLFLPLDEGVRFFRYYRRRIYKSIKHRISKTMVS